MEFSSEEYMEGCEPITAICVKDGVPMLGFYRGKVLDGFGCGHCGLFVTTDNRKLHDMARMLN